MHGLIKHSRMTVDRCATNNEVSARPPSHPFFPLTPSVIRTDVGSCVPNGGRIRNNASHFPDHRSPGVAYERRKTIRKAKMKSQKVVAVAYESERC